MSALGIALLVGLVVAVVVRGVTHTLTFSAGGFSDGMTPITVSTTGSLGLEIDEDVAASTTDQLLTIAIDVSEIESLIIFTDGALTVETNSSSAPAQTLTFAADKPLVWASGMPSSCPLTTDVTALYFTNAGGSSVNIRGIINLSI